MTPVWWFILVLAVLCALGVLFGLIAERMNPTEEDWHDDEQGGGPAPRR